MIGIGMEEHRNTALNNTLTPWRIWIFAIVIGLAFLVFTGRLFNLQVIEYDDWVAQAKGNSTETLNLPAPRGIMVDRNDTVLARNLASYNVVIVAADLPDDEGAKQEIFRQLSAHIDVPVNLNEISPENLYVPCQSEHGIAQIAEYGITTTPYTPVRVKCNIEKSLAMVVQEKAVDWPGVSIEIEPVRDYPTGDLTSNLVGYLGPIPAEFADLYIEQGLVANRDKVGYAGAELSLQSILAGQNGTREVEVDVGGQVLRDILPPVPAVPGLNVRLTLDTRLQQAAQTILIKEMDALNRISSTGIRATSGVVIALNPATGEVIAMVSYPSFENNRMARQIPFYYMQQLEEDGREPLLNHAIQAERPSGSVFKLVTATGALNEGVVTAEQIVDAPGRITLTEKYYANDPGRAKDFVDWNEEQGGFGQIDFVNGIANSSNVYFYKLGGGYRDEVPEGLNICRLGSYAKALGFGQPSGIELPGEEDGLIPDPSWKRITKGENWSTGDTYLASVGQGYILSTPLQVLLSASTIANDGKLMQPTILREVFDGEGNVVQSFTPQVKWNVTQDPVVEVFEPQASVSNSCRPTGEFKTIDSYVVQKVQEGMREAVLSGTLQDEFSAVQIAAAGKTGTAEYCDDIAQSKNLCQPGNWPTHGWTVAYAPFENPEIAVVAFVYNGGEGAKIAGPIVRQVIQYYFELKAIDTALGR